jgi:hypothetical protein
MQPNIATTTGENLHVMRNVRRFHIEAAENAYRQKDHERVTWHDNHVDLITKSIERYTEE